MTKDEALDLALDALEKISRTHYYIETPPIESLEEKMRRIADKAITAIKQALAAPVPTNCRHCGGPNNVLCAGQCKAAAPNLQADLVKANAQAEYFEREWYLRGDELEATNRQVEILSDALAESRREVAALKINAALDKMAENARDLGLDYEPDYKVTVVDDQHPNGVPLEQWGRVAEQGEDHMRQLIEDLISAMEYHVEQTRPIHSTTVALQAAREAIRAQPAPVQEPVAVCHDDGYWTPLKTEAGRRFNDLLSKAGSRINVYTTPPAAQRQWVGLTDEEIYAVSKETHFAQKPVAAFARAIEAKLKEKNT